MKLNQNCATGCLNTVGVEIMYSASFVYHIQEYHGYSCISCDIFLIWYCHFETSILPSVITKAMKYGLYSYIDICVLLCVP